MGIALGCIGLSYDDFCRCYPDEYYSIAKAWHEMRDAEMKADWERMRLLATITIQPHTKRKITAQKLVPLPWDNTKKKTPRKAEADTMTVEQHRQRAAELERRLNSNS